MQITVNRDCVVATGSTAEVIDCLFGPQQHAEHCKGWRWHQYVGDSEKRWEGVKAEMRRMIAERRALEELV